MRRLAIGNENCQPHRGIAIFMRACARLAEGPRLVPSRLMDRQVARFVAGGRASLRSPPSSASRAALSTMSRRVTIQWTNLGLPSTRGEEEPSPGRRETGRFAHDLRVRPRRRAGRFRDRTVVPGSSSQLINSPCRLCRRPAPPAPQPALNRIEEQRARHRHRSQRDRRVVDFQRRMSVVRR